MPTHSTPQADDRHRSAGDLPDPLVPGESLDSLLGQALAEDRHDGDVTSETIVPEHVAGRARLVAKAPGVLAGLGVFVRVFELCDPNVEVDVYSRDGQCVVAGEEVASIGGLARSLLLAERTALNLLQHASGIATRTRALVDMVQGTPVRILDTRKTTPLWRALEKYAVRCGGGENHRLGLWDEAMIKENHLALAGRSLFEALGALRGRLGPDGRIHCEAETAEEAREAVLGGADVVLLDEIAPEQMGRLAPELRALAAERGRPVELEASGGITEQSLRAVAQSGVDRISIGGLTHTVKALDLSLRIEPARGEAGA